jgi:hypothetical protein
MKLTKISARNFKGLTFTLDLGAINFLVGSNFAGKTARTDAIRLFLLGHLPELGKTNEATFGLASGRVMHVEGEFDDGTQGFRTWKADGNSIKKVEQLPPAFEQSEELVALMLNAETYFAKSERARVDYVARNVKLGSEWSADEIVGKVVACLGDACDESTKVAALLTHAAAQTADGEGSPQEFVEAAIAAVDDAGKAAKAHAAKMEKTAQGLAYLRANDEPAVDLGALDRKREDLLREVASLVGTRERHSAAYESAVANRRRRAELTASISGKARLVAAKDAAAGKIEAANYDLSRLTARTDEEIDKLRAEENDARASLRDHEKDLKLCRESLAFNEAALMAVDIDEKCPYCGASGDGWKTLKRAEIASALAGLKTKEAQLVEHVDTLRAQVEARFTAALEARNEQSQLQTTRSTLATLQRDGDAVEKSLAVIESKEEEISKIPPEDASVTAAVEAAQTAINVKNDEIAALDRDRKTAMGRASELQRLAQAETDRDGAKKEEEIAKLALAKLRETQAAMVTEAFRPILNEANRLFGHALKTPLEYNAEKAEIGTRRAGVWVGHKTFSGVEKLLCYAAIQMSLASKSPIRIMLLDEMLRAQGAVFSEVVDACKQAVREHGIDQFVGVIPGDSPLYDYLADNSDCKVVAIE